MAQDRAARPRHRRPRRTPQRWPFPPRPRRRGCWPARLGLAAATAFAIVSALMLIIPAVTR